jgi:hypothetical protein
MQVLFFSNAMLSFTFSRSKAKLGLSQGSHAFDCCTFRLLGDMAKPVYSISLVTPPTEVSRKL